MAAVGPLVSFLIVLVIGVAAGLIYDRVAGPGWLGRQIAGKKRGMVTSALVGIAGAFIGFHIAGLLRLAFGSIGLYVGAAVGAAVVLWLWRVMR